MNLRTKSLTIAIILFAALAIPLLLVPQEQQLAKTGPPRYTVTYLGTLGGSFSEGVGINNRGSVSGNSTLPGDSVHHGFFWRNGVMTDLGTLGGPNSFAPEEWAPNGRDDVAGFSDTATLDPNAENFCGPFSFISSPYICLPFVWQDGVLTALPTLGGNNGGALAINNRGQVVGVSETNIVDPSCAPFQLSDIKAVLWGPNRGEIRELPPLPGDTEAVPSGINDNGQVVGASGNCSVGAIEAVLWQDGVPTNLGTLGGTVFNIAFGINNRGQVVGQSNLPSDTTHHAFLWQNGVMTDLGTLPGLPNSLATSINNRSQVVGFSQDANGDILSTVAWIWQDGVMTDLNTLIPSNSPLFLAEALGINDRGQIAGFAFDTQAGEAPGFLATPVLGNESGAIAAPGPTRERPKIDLPESVRKLLQQRLGFGRFAAPPQKAALYNQAATSVPTAALSPTSLAFSTQAIGTTSAANTVTLKNTGSTTLTISGIAITGSNVGDFAQTHTCGSSLAAGASCSISITFKPTASGTRSAALSLTDNAPGSPQKVSLSGIGTTAELSPTSLDFGTVAIGTTTPATTVTLTNVGTTALTISRIAITGTNVGDFALSSSCASSLPAGASCAFSVTFKPTANGTRTAAVSVTDNAAGSPQKVPLSGTGTTAKLSPASVNFGLVRLGASLTKAVTLTNVGATAMSITGFAITGTNAGDFAQTHTCGTSLAAGASCTVSVTFKPLALGTRTAALLIYDNAAGSPQTVALTGTGAPTCIPQGGACFGPSHPNCCPAPRGHHSFCSNPTGWGTCTES